MHMRMKESAHTPKKRENYERITVKKNRWAKASKTSLMDVVKKNLCFLSMTIIRLH